MVTRTSGLTEWVEKDGKRMGYRYLGKTGIKVSILSYGNWLTSDAHS
jgi:hypothetical protein